VKNKKLIRKEIIDNRSKQAGWNVADRTQVIEEFDIIIIIIIDSNLVRETKTPYAGHQFSDYVLLSKDGKPLAVVEAKKSSVDAADGRKHDKQYSNHNKNIHRVEIPFRFFANGHDIYFWDLDNYPTKKVYAFPIRNFTQALINISSRNFTIQ